MNTRQQKRLEEHHAYLSIFESLKNIRDATKAIEEFVKEGRNDMNGINLDAIAITEDRIKLELESVNEDIDRIGKLRGFQHCETCTHTLKEANQ